MSTSTVGGFSYYVPLSNCQWLRNFTFPDMHKFTLCQDLAASPLITILNPTLVPPDQFTWQEQITNPTAADASQDVTATLFIANLTASDIATITRNGNQLSVVDVPGGVNILYGGSGTDMPPGFNDVGAWVITYTPSAGPPGPQSANTTLQDGYGTSIGSVNFSVIVPSTTIPFIVSITPPTGDPAGGTPVSIQGYNYNLAPSLDAATAIVTVGGSPLTGITINIATGVITGTTTPLLTGNADNWLVECTPIADPAFGTDHLWDWIIDQWYETAPVGTWAGIDPATDWLPGVF